MTFLLLSNASAISRFGARYNLLRRFIHQFASYFEPIHSTGSQNLRWPSNCLWHGALGILRSNEGIFSRERSKLECCQHLNRFLNLTTHLEKISSRRRSSKVIVECLVLLEPCLPGRGLHGTLQTKGHASPRELQGSSRSDFPTFQLTGLPPERCI